MNADAFLDLAERQIAAPRKARLRATATRAERKAAAEREQQSRLWVDWRRERRETLLAGPHGAAAAQLVASLEALTIDGAAELVEVVQHGPWRDADPDTRFEVLALIDAAITSTRERQDLSPFDDPLPGERPTAFQVIKDMLA